MALNQDFNGSGFSPDFLGNHLEVPQIDAPLQADTARLNGSVVIPYTHFSLALSRSRGFARWVAWNIDGGSLRRINRKGLSFTKDPRIPGEYQNGDELYSANRLDRGHLARRADLVWGPLEEAEAANNDSFFFTNIAPHMDDFNQSSKDGVWGRLEEAVFADVDVQDLRVSVFGGPVFQDTDREYRGVKLPREYWKVLAYVEHGVFKTSAFLLTQNLNPFEALDRDEFRAYQVSMAEIEQRTGVRFGHARTADAFPAPPESGPRNPLDSPADIRW